MPPLAASAVVLLLAVALVAVDIEALLLVGAAVARRRPRLLSPPSIVSTALKAAAAAVIVLVVVEGLALARSIADIATGMPQRPSADRIVTSNVGHFFRVNNPLKYDRSGSMVIRYSIEREEKIAKIGRKRTLAFEIVVVVDMFAAASVFGN